MAEITRTPGAPLAARFAPHRPTAAVAHTRWDEAPPTPATPTVVRAAPVDGIDPALDDDATTARTAQLGAAVGFVLGTVAVGLGGILGGLKASSAIGLALFCGVWGGAGFGFMIGGTWPLARRMDARAAAAGHGPARATG